MARYKTNRNGSITNTETGENFRPRKDPGGNSRAVEDYFKWVDEGNTPDPADPPPPPPPRDPRIEAIPASVNSVAALRNKLNEILEYIRRE